MRVLLLEDDRVLGEAVRDHIAADGHAVDWARQISGARHHLDVADYQLVLLDLHLPDGHGLDLLREMRAASNATPVIILTARDQVSDRIDGLNAGADDYLVKPFNLAELSARVGAVSRRYGGSPSPVLRFGELEIDQANRILLRAGVDQTLSAREWAVFEQFLRRPAAIVSKQQIEDALYAFGSEIESNTVEVYVSRLRKKIGRDAITTLRGVGYRLVTA